MQMNFIKTPLDNDNIGEELYFLAYNKNEKFFVKKVTFIGLDCKEYSGNSEYYNNTEFYCAIFEYIDDKGKNKQFKLKWSYSKHDKPKYKKSKNFIYFEEEQLTCIKTQNCDPGYYSIYIILNILQFQVSIIFLHIYFQLKELLYMQQIQILYTFIVMADLN